MKPVLWCMGRQASFIKLLMAEQQRHVSSSCVGDGWNWTHTVLFRVWLNPAFALANYAKGVVLYGRAFIFKLRIDSDPIRRNKTATHPSCVRKSQTWYYAHKNLHLLKQMCNWSILALVSKLYTEWVRVAESTRGRRFQFFSMPVMCCRDLQRLRRCVTWHEQWVRWLGWMLLSATISYHFLAAHKRPDECFFLQQCHIIFLLLTNAKTWCLTFWLWCLISTPTIIILHMDPCYESLLLLDWSSRKVEFLFFINFG